MRMAEHLQLYSSKMYVKGIVEVPNDRIDSGLYSFGNEYALIKCVKNSCLKDDNIQGISIEDRNFLYLMGGTNGERRYE